MPRPETAEPAARPRARLRDYLALTRPGHWIKHAFIVPGIVLAALLHEPDGTDLVGTVLLGFLSAAAIASANYVLNEWLDAPTDAHHPLKAERSAVSSELSPALVALEYGGLAAAGIALASQVSPLFLATSALFLAFAWVYNVRPLRSKDRAYVDVLSESFNNPIRLTLGWAMVDTHTLPPASLLAAFWMGGAFLMTVKRLAELRTVTALAGAERLASYRQAFAAYTEKSLLIAAFAYSQLAAFFIAVFLVKYRIEYLLSLPLFTALFGVYLAIGLRKRSPAQAPERLFREKRLLAIALGLVVLLAWLTWVDIDALDRLADPHYIRLSFP